MQTYLKANICAVATTIFLATALAGQGAEDKSLLAEPHVTITGSLQGQETDVLQGDPPEKILVDGKASGLASHWGHFDLTYKVTVKLPEGSSRGSGQLTTANGDTIFTTIAGLGESLPDVPNVSQILEVHTIKGGTGQFAKAKGTLIVERIIDQATGASYGSLRALIIAPGAAQ